MEHKVMYEWFVKEKRMSLHDLRSWWNGYVIIHESHPLFARQYDDDYFPFEMTFGRRASDVYWDHVPEQYRKCEYWVYGFDTLGTTRSKESVEKEAAEMAMWFYLEHIKAVRNDNRSECGAVVREEDEGGRKGGSGLYQGGEHV